MEAWLHDWLSLLLRWVHLITGVAWIGASFYFNWLENQLQRRAAAPGDPTGGDPIAGDLWAVHGGGFYYLQKYRLAPDELPTHLHWFKYEAYFTWLTGFALLAVVYYWNATLYLVDPAVSAIPVIEAVALGLASLLVSWLIYDSLCRSALQRHTLALSLLILAWFTLLAFVLGEILSGRAAYLHVGAAIGTVMVANVFFVIIPAQKDMVAALSAGRVPDGTKGRNALLRSRHNNYLTLPVLFIMISLHYPASFGGPYPWLFLLVFSVAAAGIRHWFNVRHLPTHPRWIFPVSLLVLLALMLSTLPRHRDSTPASAPPTTAEILPLIRERCTGCHAARPTLAGLPAPPLGVLLETESQVKAQADRIYQTTFATRMMPLGNLTGMSEDERKRLSDWYFGQLNAAPEQTEK